MSKYAPSKYLISTSRPRVYREMISKCLTPYIKDLYIYQDVETPKQIGVFSPSRRYIQAKLESKKIYINAPYANWVLKNVLLVERVVNLLRYPVHSEGRNKDDRYYHGERNIYIERLIYLIEVRENGTRPVKIT